MREELEKFLSLHLLLFAFLVAITQIITATKLIEEIIVISDFSCRHVPDFTQFTEFHLFIAFCAMFIYCDIVAYWILLLHLSQIKEHLFLH